MIISKLETERLYIRCFNQNDMKSVHSYMSDPNIIEHLPEDLFSENDAKEFIDENTSENAENFALILKGDESLVGHMIFHKWFAPNTFEIGWVIHSAYQRKGFASEAALKLLTFGFDTLSAHRIIATCQPENPASWKIMEKIGMRKEGHFKKCLFRRERWIDELFYAILSDEWTNN
jgi:[ribosomal protein S5]-alanine N-acetyltransferase